MMRAKWLGLVLMLAAMLAVGLVWFPGAAKPHSVTLTWQPSPKPVAGYNVYRRTSDETQLIRIASGVREPRYEDRIVSSGRTYFYAVTAVDAAGRESGYSAEIKATVP
jgi:fibronectin type 3 domain-containing protein